MPATITVNSDHRPVDPSPYREKYPDETLRRLGGSPTYGLTDNERTVTTDRVAGIGVRHPIIVATGHAAPTV